MTRCSLGDTLKGETLFWGQQGHSVVALVGESLCLRGGDAIVQQKTGRQCHARCGSGSLTAGSLPAGSAWQRF